jgi:hypothetical protein
MDAAHHVAVWMIVGVAVGVVEWLSAKPAKLDFGKREVRTGYPKARVAWNMSVACFLGALLTFAFPDDWFVRGVLCAGEVFAVWYALKTWTMCVVLRGTTLTVRSLFGERSVDLRDVPVVTTSSLWHAYVFKTRSGRVLRLDRDVTGADQIAAFAER